MRSNLENSLAVSLKFASASIPAILVASAPPLSEALRTRVLEKVACTSRDNDAILTVSIRTPGSRRFKILPIRASAPIVQR
jgi:hypothetical protein